MIQDESLTFSFIIPVFYIHLWPEMQLIRSKVSFNKHHKSKMKVGKIIATFESEQPECRLLRSPVSINIILPSMKLLRIGN